MGFLERKSRKFSLFEKLVDFYSINLAYRSRN